MQGQDVGVEKEHVVGQEIPQSEQVPPLVVWCKQEQADQKRDRDAARVHEHVEQRLVPGIVDTLVYPFFQETPLWKTRETASKEGKNC